MQMHPCYHNVILTIDVEAWTVSIRLLSLLIPREWLSVMQIDLWVASSLNGVTNRLCFQGQHP